MKIKIHHEVILKNNSLMMSTIELQIQVAKRFQIFLCTSMPPSEVSTLKRGLSFVEATTSMLTSGYHNLTMDSQRKWQYNANVTSKQRQFIIVLLPLAPSAV